MKLPLAFACLALPAAASASQWADTVLRLFKLPPGQAPATISFFQSTARRAFVDDLPKRIVIDGAGSVPGSSIHTEIYVSDGLICVEGMGTERWNLVADGRHIYEWKGDERTGLREKYDVALLASYLYYLIDPAGIMGSTYAEYARDPSRFIATKANGLTEIAFKDSKEFPITVLVKESPPWLAGMRIKDPDSGKSATTRFREPEHIEKMPEKIGFLLREIDFRDSDLTVKRHMAFL